MTNDTYLPVDEIAERLGLPLGVLVRRVEAGDVPARLVEGPLGPRYELRLEDLGVELPANGSEATAWSDVELTGSSPAESPRWYAEPELESQPTEITDEEKISFTSVELEIEPNDGEVVPPPPSPSRSNGLVNFASNPLADVASMSLDARELVAGLLDRWERTLEQRIYAEQRQRFETEITARQAIVRELHLELKATRAENAAAQAEKDRILAERQRVISDKERELQFMRQQAAAKPKRRWGIFGR